LQNLSCKTKDLKYVLNLSL